MLITSSQWPPTLSCGTRRKLPSCLIIRVLSDPQPYHAEWGAVQTHVSKRHFLHTMQVKLVNEPSETVHNWDPSTLTEALPKNQSWLHYFQRSRKPKMRFYAYFSYWKNVMNRRTADRHAELILVSMLVLLNCNNTRMIHTVCHICSSEKWSSHALRRWNKTLYFLIPIQLLVHVHMQTEMPKKPISNFLSKETRCYIYGKISLINFQPPHENGKEKIITAQ